MEMKIESRESVQPSNPFSRHAVLPLLEQIATSLALIDALVLTDQNMLLYTATSDSQI